MFAMGACTTSNFVRLLGLPGDYSPVCSYSLLGRPWPLLRAGTVLPCGQCTPAMYSAHAAAAGVNALAVLTISDSMVTGEATSAMERETSFTQMMEVALSLVS